MAKKSGSRRKGGRSVEGDWGRRMQRHGGALGAGRKADGGRDLRKWGEWRAVGFDRKTSPPGTWRVVANNLYCVDMAATCDMGGNPYLILKVRRIDGGSAIDWNTLQRIKRELAGEGVEAVELYPHAERDFAQIRGRWLYCLPPDRAFPFGVGVSPNEPSTDVEPWGTPPFAAAPPPPYDPTVPARILAGDEWSRRLHEAQAAYEAQAPYAGDEVGPDPEEAGAAWRMFGQFKACADGETGEPEWAQKEARRIVDLVAVVETVLDTSITCELIECASKLCGANPTADLPALLELVAETLECVDANDQGDELAELAQAAGRISLEAYAEKLRRGEVVAPVPAAAS